MFFAQLSEADVYKGLELDLKGISEILGDKKYLFGNEPTTADFALFGQLTVGTYTYDDNLLKTLFKKFPKLEDFMENMIEDIFPKYSTRIHA